jgi:transcriptional regulator with XRE-family HTH domain
MSEVYRTPNQRVAARVQELRKGQDMSQRGLAQRMRGLGCLWNDTIVSRVERGERDVDVNELVALGLVLGVSPIALFSPSGDAGITDAGITFEGQLDPQFVPLKERLFHLWLVSPLRLRFDPSEGVRVLIPTGDVVEPDAFFEALRGAPLPGYEEGD